MSAWERTVDELLSYRPDAPARLVVAVCGPKGAGKSTFCRHVTLKSSGALLLLAADVARPELTLPGLVSLYRLAPGEERVTLGRIFLGEDSAVQCPVQYLNALGELVDLAEQPAFAALPLVVDTMGWGTGLVKNILEALLTRLTPSDVVQIVPARKMETLGSVLPTGLDAKVWTLEPAVEHRQREAADDVTVHAVALFSEARAFCVGLAKIKLTLNAALAEADLAHEFVLLALNGAVVGLLNKGSGPRATRFVGVGLVHLVDRERQLLVVRVPHATAATLAGVDEVVVGSSLIVPPSRFPTRPSSGTRPYVAMRSHLVGSAEAAQRTEIKRKRLDASLPQTG